MAPTGQAPPDKGQGAGAEVGSDEVGGEAVGGGKSAGLEVQTPELSPTSTSSSLRDLLQVIISLDPTFLASKIRGWGSLNRIISFRLKKNQTSGFFSDPWICTGNSR